jgi:hypothetical protein
MPVIHDMANVSADFTIEERGWFRNVTTFQQLYNEHPIPTSQSPEEIFIDWRDSLLAFLDSNHSGAGEGKA